MSDPGCLASPATGRVLEILVAVGDTVVEDQELLVLESMKMEIPVQAPHGGRVTMIHVQVDAPVQEGEALVTFER